MSIEALTWALDARRTGPMGPEHRLVLAALADYANAEHDHQAWPAVATLARRIGTTTRSINRALAALADAGHIARGEAELVAHLPANRRPTVWRLDVGRGDASVTPARVTPATPRGDTSVPAGVTAVSDKPITEPLREPHPQTPAPDVHRRRAYAATVDAAKARHRLRRPDGSCRQCDDPHPLGTPCPPVTPPPPDWRNAPPSETATPHDQPLPLT